MPKVTEWQDPNLNSELCGLKAYTTGFIENMEYKLEERGIPGQRPRAKDSLWSDTSGSACLDGVWAEGRGHAENTRKLGGCEDSQQRE